MPALPGLQAPRALALPLDEPQTRVLAMRLGASRSFPLIDSFSGRHRFLSNFYPASIVLDGEEYPTVEHAYQAAKTVDSLARAFIRGLSRAGDAKRAGKAFPLRPDWEEMKLPIMESLLWQKFAAPPLRTWLLDTGDQVLVEGNYWGDEFWGVCRGRGENHLGKLLMKVRNELRRPTRCTCDPDDLPDAGCPVHGGA